MGLKIKQMAEELENEQLINPEETPQEYTGNSIQVLEGLEAVRKRPAMYIGDTSVKGLHHLVSEVVDNSIDEALAGFATHIEVTITTENGIKVVDNGRGIPVDENEKLHKSALEVVMTVLHAGGKFDKGTYKVSGGLHGVGVSCVNALSTYLRAEVHRNGKIYMQEYAYGKPTCPVHIIGDTDHSGTEVSFQPDDSIFTETVYEWDRLAERLRDLAFLNAGIRITLTDLRELNEAGQPRTETFFSANGLEDFVKYLDKGKTSLIGDVIHINTEREQVPVEVALTYNDTFRENIKTYVNNIHTSDGGTHLKGFRGAVGFTLKKYADDKKLLEKEKVEVKPEDFSEGLTAVVSVKVLEPQFEGQTKGKLGNKEVEGIVRDAVKNALANYLEENPQQASLIMKKMILAAKARVAADNARRNVQRKSPLGGGGMPGKLTDCSSRKAEECELFLVEGDSAGGSAKEARDRHFQAIMPLRGKILNVEKALDHKVFENEEIVNIFRALGVTPIMKNREEDAENVNIDVANVDISKIRYHKIIIMTDADVDGAHIATLLMTLFYRRMRQVIEHGHLYIATPPLYKCTAVRKKHSEYCWSDEQVEEFKAKWLEGDDNSGNFKIQRYKGLGEMNPEQLAETTMDPANRVLKQVHISDAEEADKIFTMLMGEDVEPRREFIETNAHFANIDN